MAIGIFVGVTLVMVGLLLLAHLSYTNYGKDPCLVHDPEDAVNGSRGFVKTNDCPLPLCFFHVASIANHETWVVSFLLAGSAVLMLSLAVGY
jgi:hypothetical protein